HPPLAWTRHGPPTPPRPPRHFPAHRAAEQRSPTLLRMRRGLPELPPGAAGGRAQAWFKSALVDSDTYLLTCYRYLELNPVRAGMAPDPGDYPWSSYRRNAFGARDPAIAPHPNYVALAREPTDRLIAYRA